MANDTLPDFLKLPYSELDALFATGAGGRPPGGDAGGSALIATGTFLARPIAGFIRVFVWQGKIFNSADGLLKNKLTPFGIRAVIGKFYIGPSWFDGKECVVLDYSQTSLVARWVRDELREIRPGTYLGKVFLGHKPLFHFTLQF